MQSNYDRNYLLMDDQDKVVFRLVVNICNIEAYDDATKTASEWFLTWDILEDAMPFLTQPAIDVDIQWTKSDLEQRVQELGLEKQQIVILINSGQLTGVPHDSAVLGSWGNYSVISSLLDPTRVVMEATLTKVQEVGDRFLSGCSSLKEMNLSPLSNVRKVGDFFLYRCSSLHKVDLSPLSNVQKVGNSFLYGCSSVKKLDLSPLSNVQEVGDYFLSGCSSLKEVDLSLLSNLQVGHNFLSRCSSLKEVDLSPLSSTQEVGSHFLYGCTSLKEVDLSPLSNVQKVGDHFLSACHSLKEVDLTPLSNMQKVGRYFLNECLSLTRVILPAAPPEALRLAVPPHLSPLPVRLQSIAQRACALS